MLRNLSFESRPYAKSPRALLAIAACGLALGALIPAGAGAKVRHGEEKEEREKPPNVRLGERLFTDKRFSSPLGDLQHSCRTCHIVDEDVRGIRAYTDFLVKSWVPYRDGDLRRDGLRNSPTILDAGLMPHLHYDGEFSSLEGLVKGTLSTRNMGWIAGEEDQAFDRVREVLITDKGEGELAEGTYVQQFKKAYEVDLTKISRDEMIDWTARSIADYVRSLETTKDSAYDLFIKSNGLPATPASGETPTAFATRLLADVASLEAAKKLSLTGKFDASALAGMKVFFRSEGPTSAGNCVACHIPPNFTDFNFHNLGVSQAEYELRHGRGSFAKFDIPKAGAAQRPVANLKEVPAREKPNFVDLGYWNYADLKNSRSRRQGESDEAFLDRMIGAMKTPTLRNLGFTEPYMHNGAYQTLDQALAAILDLSERARAGEIRSADDEFSKVRLAEEDLVPLAAFLGTLNEKYE